MVRILQQKVILGIIATLLCVAFAGRYVQYKHELRVWHKEQPALVGVNLALHGATARGQAASWHLVATRYDDDANRWASAHVPDELQSFIRVRIAEERAYAATYEAQANAMTPTSGKTTLHDRWGLPYANPTRSETAHIARLRDRLRVLQRKMADEVPNPPSFWSL